MDARARAQARSADIAVTVCGGFTLNSGRQQQTMSTQRAVEKSATVL